MMHVANCLQWLSHVSAVPLKRLCSEGNALNCSLLQRFCDTDFVNSRYRNILTYLLTYYLVNQNFVRRKIEENVRRHV